MNKTRASRFGAVVLMLLIACNKNTDQLPPVKSPSKELIINAKLNGVQQLEFIFRQEKASGKDTVWLSVKNATISPVSHLSYVVELCNAAPQNFDNCDLQHIEQRTDTIEAGGIKKDIFFWANKDIVLDESLINVGIVSYEEQPPHPLANIYSNIYAVFESEEIEQTHYGQVRGYVLADGESMFRLKGTTGELFNASGQFTQDFAFDGLLKESDEILTPFKLDSVETDAGNVLIDLADQKLNMRLKLLTPVGDTTRSLLLFTQRNY